jgi:hypothetical protein
MDCFVTLATACCGIEGMQLVARGNRRVSWPVERPNLSDFQMLRGTVPGSRPLSFFTSFPIASSTMDSDRGFLCVHCRYSNRNLLRILVDSQCHFLDRDAFFWLSYFFDALTSIQASFATCQIQSRVCDFSCQASLHFPSLHCSNVLKNSPSHFASPAFFFSSSPASSSSRQAINSIRSLRAVQSLSSAFATRFESISLLSECIASHSALWLRCSSSACSVQIWLNLLVPTIGAVICTVARPSRNWDGRFLCSQVRKSREAHVSLSSLLPLASRALPLPAESKKLKYLTLGRGLMTYECKSPTTESDRPVYLHQNSELYDVAPLAQNLPDVNALHALVPQFCEYDYSELRNTTMSCVGRINSQSGETIVDLPGFNEPEFSVEVTWAVPSPHGQDVNGYWDLSASENDDWQIYRVETTGGAAPTTCKGHENSTLDISYAAEYWFYHT